MEVSREVEVKYRVVLTSEEAQFLRSVVANVAVGKGRAGDLAWRLSTTFSGEGVPNAGDPFTDTPTFKDTWRAVAGTDGA